MPHEDYCAISELGVCSCRPGWAGRAWVEYGPRGLPTAEGYRMIEGYNTSAPKLLSDDEAVQSLVDVDYLASKQDRVEKLRKKGIVLCRVS